MSAIETHPFRAFVPPNAVVLIVGSFPGKEHTSNTSIDNHWFYSAKRNQFWSIISAVYNVELTTTAMKKELFREKGIAIADIFLKIKRKEDNNKDENLEVVEYNDKAIRLILDAMVFDQILFTSKFVAKHFMKCFPEVTNGAYLPSPSPLYAKMTKAEKVNFYKRRLPV